MQLKFLLRGIAIGFINVSLSAVVGVVSANTQVEAARFGGPDWMYEMRNEIGDIPINKLIIPGSHDSFTSTLVTKKGGAPDSFNKDLRSLIRLFSGESLAGRLLVEPHILGFIKDWGQTQTFSIKRQLEYGIRYFDFRMCGEESRVEISHCHGLYTAEGAMDVLKVVSDFHKAHPNELLILHYSHFDNLSQQTKNHFAQSILNQFGPRMIPSGKGFQDYTLNRLWKEGKTVLVIYEDAKARKWAYSPEKFWDEAGLMINGWADASQQNKLLNRVSTNLDCRCNSREKNKEKNGSINPEKLFNLAIQPTPDKTVIMQALYSKFIQNRHPTLMNYAYAMQRAVLAELDRKLKKEPWLRENLNVISADVVERVRLVEIVTEMNRKLKLDRTPPVSVLRALTEPNEAGWHNEDVTLELTATDNEGGYGVRSISYQVPGKPGHWHGDDHILMEVSGEGEHLVWYESDDIGGNKEKRREMLVNLDKTAPEVTVDGIRDYRIDENILIGCTATDNLSGLKDNPCETSLIDRPAYELGAGPHSLTVTVTDVADNVTETTVTFNIIASKAWNNQSIL